MATIKMSLQPTPAALIREGLARFDAKGWLNWHQGAACADSDGNHQNYSYVYMPYTTKWCSLGMLVLIHRELTNNAPLGHEEDLWAQTVSAMAAGVCQVKYGHYDTSCLAYGGPDVSNWNDYSNWFGPVRQMWIAALKYAETQESQQVRQIADALPQRSGSVGAVVEQADLVCA